MIIDCHTHINCAADDDIGTSEHLEAVQTVDACIVFPDGPGNEVNKTLSEYVGKHKEKMVGFAVMEPVKGNVGIKGLTAIKEKQQRILLCLDRKDGEILWQRVVLEAPLERINRLNSYASSTPATDGQRVYVSFLDVDKMFVAAYDFDGNNIWEARPGVFASMHGYCSSPVIFKGIRMV